MNIIAMVEKNRVNIPCISPAEALDLTDWKVTRHLEEKTLNEETTLSEEEFQALALKRKEWRKLPHSRCAREDYEYLLKHVSFKESLPDHIKESLQYAN